MSITQVRKRDGRTVAVRRGQAGGQRPGGLRQAHGDDATLRAAELADCGGFTFSTRHSRTRRRTPTRSPRWL